MKYPRIFWLEDNPSFLQYLETDMSSLLSRVTWAHSFEQGGKVISQQDFDLYILDGDFPDRIPEDRERYIRDFICAMNEKRRSSFSFNDGQKYGGKLWNNFIRFYGALLDETKSVVVCSMSFDAAMRAFEKGLPYYSKSISDDKNETTCRIRKSLGISLDRALAPRLETWENGDLRDLTVRYLEA